MRETGIDLELEIYATKLAKESNRVGVSPNLRKETEPVSETCFFF
jgi:hypothetical protein